MTKIELIETIEKYIEENIESINCRDKPNNATILLCLETVLQTSINSLNKCNLRELKQKY